MNNLETILTIVSCMVIVVSIWMIMFFGFRIVEHFIIRRELGDMPSAEEIERLYSNIDKVHDEILKLYELNNDQIRYPFGKN